jgi:RNA polymerase sigma factor (sigma-70 family)
LNINPNRVEESYYKLLEARDPRAWRCAFDALYPVALKNASNGKGALGLEDAKELALQAVDKIFGILEEARFRSRWVGLEKEEVLAQLGAMVAVIARRLRISSNRKHFSAKREGGNLHTPLEEALLSKDNGYKMLELADALRVMRKVIDGHLDDNERELLQDYYLEGLTLKEVSTRHGMPLGSVGTKIGRVLLKLRKKVEEEGVNKESLTYFLREEETFHPAGKSGHE